MSVLHAPTDPLRPPHEALQRLVQLAPSDRALAAALGTDNHAVAAWRKGTRRMRRPYVDLLPYMDAVAERLAEAGVPSRDVVYVLQQPWPALGTKPPAEVLKTGSLTAVLEAVPTVAGSATPAGVAEPAWKADVRAELDASLLSRLRQGGQLHESFSFLLALEPHEAVAFAEQARHELDRAAGEDEFDAFLAPYWQRLREHKPVERRTVIEADPDEPAPGEPFSIDDLLILDGGMASRLFSQT